MLSDAQNKLHFILFVV